MRPWRNWYTRMVEDHGSQEHVGSSPTVRTEKLDG